MATKKIKVKVLHTFNDLKDDVIRKKDEIFETNKNRFMEINRASNEYFGEDYVVEVSNISSENG